MAMNVQERDGRFQLRVKHKLLPRAFFFTFASHDEAHDYGTKLEAMLARGIIPVEISEKLSKPSAHTGDPLATDVLDQYAAGNTAVSKTDLEMVRYVKPELLGMRMGQVDYKWAEDLIRRMKVEAHLAPSTIRARVGLLGRVWQWYAAQSGRNLPNPWRLMPRGYSIANQAEAKELAKKGKPVKRDQHRDRRLTAAEADNIARVLAGEKIVDRERGLKPDPEFALMYELIVESGLRLIEAYTLSVHQIDMDAWIIRVRGAKGHRGAPKPRDTPMKSELHAKLKAWIEALPEGETRLFPKLWDGSWEDEALRRTSNRLSQRFSTLFEHAKCPDVTEHDLRHEATCRWLELKDESGRYMYQDIEVIKMMGWSRADLLLRYASIRGSDLASRLKPKA